MMKLSATVTTECEEWCGVGHGGKRLLAVRLCGGVSDGFESTTSRNQTTYETEFKIKEAKIDRVPVAGMNQR
ncbi:hypothetical protein HanIR_Chr14g0685601 [Helianthus annuus]|nr:hypothetical protein HanIR_Chr14g0685601 [Helianthus annuus]